LQKVRSSSRASGAQQFLQREHRIHCDTTRGAFSIDQRGGITAGSLYINRGPPLATVHITSESRSEGGPGGYRFDFTVNVTEHKLPLLVMCVHGTRLTVGFVSVWQNGNLVSRPPGTSVNGREIELSIPHAFGRHGSRPH
jgi:hypothetical protein